MSRNICVIGGGKWGRNHIKTLHELNSLAGIVELDSQILEGYKNTYPGLNYFDNIDDAISFGFDGFIISTPAETHYKIAKVVLESNYPVLIEKPITTNVDDAIDLNRIAKSHNVGLMVGHLLLFHPAFMKIKSMIQDGSLGDLQYMYSNRLNLGTIRSNENVLWSFAPHDISLFQYLVGVDPIKINCCGNDHLQEGIHDTTITTIEYPQKIMGHIFVSWLHPFKEHRFVVIGSKGMIHFEDSKKDKPLKFYEKTIKWEGNKPITDHCEAINIEYDKSMPLKLELEYFMENLDRPFFDKANGKSAIEVMKILEKGTERLIKNKESS